MGNQSSLNKELNTNTVHMEEPKNLENVLDYVATHYILTMDFNSLRKLKHKKYCDRLVILTSDILQGYFTNFELKYLEKRIQNGNNISEEFNKDNIVFYNKDQLHNLDIQNLNKKQNICKSIAKFYIKIAHLFAAIVMTINPIYIYKDSDGLTRKANLYQKNKIPEDTSTEVFKFNICENRVNILINGQKDIVEKSANGEEVEIAPNFCQSNLNIDNSNKSLYDEPGIPELEELYYDDVYDYDKGKFTGMSEETKHQFNNDLKLFYQVYTGNKDMPSEITKFSDIKLRDYHNLKQCKGNSPVFESIVKGNDKLFMDYANNIKEMIKKSNNGQEELLTIINELFVYSVEPQTNKKIIRINPKLNDKSLQELVEKARGLIIQLYLACENDYITGLKIYETIVEKKILETAQNQIRSLEKMKENLLSSIQQENIK